MAHDASGGGSDCCHGHGETAHAGMQHGDMDHGDGHDGGHGGSMGHMMSMSFHFGYNETILFEWWKTTTANELFVAMFVVGVVAALYEGIKYTRESILRSSKACRTSSIPGSRTALHGASSEPGCLASMFSSMHVIQTLFHAVQFTISYMLMLVFMTYNVYLCIGVVIGASIGYFLFGWRSASPSFSSVTEHCH